MRPLLPLLLIAAPALAQEGDGFAGLGEEAEGFAPVRPGVPIALPEDHAAHPEFRIEWWYVTANLRGEDGRDYGAQWTLFRMATDPEGEGEGWPTPQLWMGHAAATSAGRHRAAERFARGGVGQAGVELGAGPGAGAPGGFDAWIDDWRMVSTIDGEAAPGADPLSRLQVSAEAEDFAYDLALEAEGPFVRHGEAGYSAKSERGQASYYYSQPFYRAEGELRLEGETVAVEGVAWLDREWSSQPLAPEQTGWDWFSLHLDDGSKVMLFRLREAGGAFTLAGTWIGPDGSAEPLDPEAIALEPLAFAEVAGREVPVEWRIAVEGRGLAVEARPLNPRAWNALSTAYWEGPLLLEGAPGGRGYLETTGY